MIDLERTALGAFYAAKKAAEDAKEKLDEAVADEVRL
jgi:hypothetical protein